MVARAVSAMAPTRAHGTPGPDRGHRVDRRLAVAAARATVMARLAPADKERIVWFCRRNLSYRLVRAAAEQRPRVSAADVGDEGVEPVAAVGQPAALDVGTEEVAEDAAEVLVARIGEERP